MLDEAQTTTELLTIRPFLGGDWVDGQSETLVADKFTDEPATRVQVPDRATVSAAVGALVSAQQQIRLSVTERYDILSRAAELLRARSAELSAAMVADTGFTVTDATREVTRSQQTLLTCAEEAKRLVGDVIPVTAAPGVRDRIGYTTYHPLGVVCAITPFNAPLNTVLHKVGPAIAAGNAVILKPAEQTPRMADAVLSLLLDAGLPAELIAVLYGPGETVGQWLLEDQGPAFYAFTGSTAVGARIQSTVGLRPTQLEMGSISSTIICADAHLSGAAQLVINAGFRKAGQVCTSVQRLYVEEDAVADVAHLLASGLAGKRVGDPTLSDTFVGPVISPSEARRVESWVAEAVDEGAEVVVGGQRDRNVIAPTVLTSVQPTSKVMSQEIFGPVVVIRPFLDLDAAIAEINDTPYGLATGVFTANIDRALTSAEQLRMGSVHINETSSSRVDLMPYTGVKASGRGIEGPRYAMREMSEQRLITIGPSGA